MAQQSEVVIIGGSIAGLCAAAALAPHAERVTVVERDAPGARRAPRKGVPQGGHGHLLLERGRRALDSLLPGIFESLERAGAQRINMGNRLRWHFHGRWMHPFESEFAASIQTRPLLEGCIRERVRELPNVTLLDELGVEHPDVAQGRVTGVTLSDGRKVPADVVIDASGRGSRTPRWLERSGYGTVRKTEVQIDLNYVTGLFELPAATRGECMIIYHQPPHQNRGAVLFPVEDGLWQVGTVTYHGEPAPTDEQAFVAWMKSLNVPDIYLAMEGGTRRSPLVHMKVPKQVRYGYASARLPRGFLVVGDALCSFDPVFGQGVTVAAMEAEILRQAARTGRLQDRSLMRAVAGATKVPWLMSMSEAFRWPATQGSSPLGGRLLRGYMARVYRACELEASVHAALSRTLHLVDPPTSLFRPKTIFRVLWPRKPAESEVR